jgi:protein dispatched 1
VSLAVVVLVYMSFHMKSLIIGSLCMIQVVMSVPVTAILFRKGLGIDYMCAMHIFSVILVLGIGADNIFVFHDHWKHTRHLKAIGNRYPLRLAYTFRKAGSAMAVTSVTTAASFLATCISPIMPVISFGVFACIVVVMNFLMIIATVPIIIIVYEVDIEPWFRCCRKKGDVEEAKPDLDLEPLPMLSDRKCQRKGIDYEDYVSKKQEGISWFF